MNNLAPIFIPSKGRHDVGTTWKQLDLMGVTRYRVIVEPQEYDLYRSVLPADKLVVLDLNYKRKYNTCDGITYAKNPRTGSGPARNMGWDIAQREGAEYHWIIDDNIMCFYMLNNNVKHVAHFDIFAKVENFVKKYKNVNMAGLQYDMFAPRKQKVKPLIINTRIFSCNLIKTETKLRWRGRYNEDVILSLDMLRHGFCTILFQAYLAKKLSTQLMKGGNTEELYRAGTEAKSRLLKSVYPDNVELVMRYGRHHHQLDYGKWKNNKLIPV